MIAFERREGERVIVDGRIVFQIVRIKGRKVRVAIEANGLRVDREEVHLARQEQEAAQVDVQAADRKQPEGIGLCP